MKKLTLIIFALLLASCGMNPVPGENGVPIKDEKETGPQQAEKAYYTLRLADDDDGTAAMSIGASRALTNELAQASHDFFEVVFYYNGTNNNAIGHRVARTTWNVGETPQLSGVYGKGKGPPADTSVNYNNVGRPTTAGTGSALLFVGTKEDKTLLAVGRLVAVDGEMGITTITTNTETVTFEAAALIAGVAPNQAQAIAGNSSFKTYGSEALALGFTGIGSTNIVPGIYLHYIGKKEFPLFKLTRSPPANYGAYNFEVYGTPNVFPIPSPNNVFNFNRYATGIVLAGERNVEARNPRYIITDGLYQYSSLLVQDLGIRTGGQLVFQNNNQRRGIAGYVPETGPSVLINPVVFKIDTSASQDNTVFALTFEVFVNNLTALPTGTYNPNASPTPPVPAPPFPSDVSPVKWRLSTGMGTKWLDLDDGSNGEGGAIFLGSGDNIAGYLDQSGNTPPGP